MVYSVDHIEENDCYKIEAPGEVTIYLDVTDNNKLSRTIRKQVGQNEETITDYESLSANLRTIIQSKIEEPLEN